MSTRHNVYLFDRQGVCPECSGMISMEIGSTNFKCIDCNSTFRVVDEGLTDNEVICECISK